MIQELVAVVSVELTQREGEALADLVDGRADPRHAMAPDRPTLVQPVATSTVTSQER